NPTTLARRETSLIPGPRSPGSFGNVSRYSGRAKKIDRSGNHFLFQFLDPSREKTALRFVTIFASQNQGERLLVRSAGLRNPAQSAAQVRAARVREMIVREMLARQQVIDKRKPLRQTFAHGNGHGAVQFDNRGWMNLEQPVVEQRNLAPVRRCRGGTLSMNGGNNRLQSVGAKAARLQSALGEREAFGDLIPVPQRPVLLLQQDQVSVGRGAGGAARLLQQHEPQQSHHLGFLDLVLLEQIEQESSQADGLAAEFGACRFGRK